MNGLIAKLYPLIDTSVVVATTPADCDFYGLLGDSFFSDFIHLQGLQ